MLLGVVSAKTDKKNTIVPLENKFGEIWKRLKNFQFLLLSTRLIYMHPTSQVTMLNQLLKKNSVELFSRIVFGSNFCLGS